MKKYLLLALVVLSLLALSACGAQTAETTQEETTTETGETAETAETVDEETYEMAPDFTVTTTAGEEVSLASYMESGKPLLVYFTASWCSTCAKNWPSIEEVYAEYGDRVNFLSISIDPTDTDEVMIALAEEKGLTYPMVAGNPDLMVAFGASKQATTIGVSAAGEIVFMKNKEVLTADEYRALLDQLLE